MSIYLVVYIAGLVGGSIGPLPYDMAECQRRAETYNAEQGTDHVSPQGWSRDDVLFVCERHSKRPEITVAQPRGQQ
jgi:hypothetical protein